MEGGPPLRSCFILLCCFIIIIVTLVGSSIAVGGRAGPSGNCDTGERCFELKPIVGHEDISRMRGGPSVQVAYSWVWHGRFGCLFSTYTTRRIQRDKSAKDGSNYFVEYSRRLVLDHSRGFSRWRNIHMTSAFIFRVLEGVRDDCRDDSELRVSYLRESTEAPAAARYRPQKHNERRRSPLTHSPSPPMRGCEALPLQEDRM